MLRSLKFKRLLLLLIAKIALKVIQARSAIIALFAYVQGRSQDPENFLNFYVKMVSSGAFWVAISYRLAACFTQIGSTRGTEIYCRLFRNFGIYNDSLRKISGGK